MPPAASCDITRDTYGDTCEVSSPAKLFRDSAPRVCVWGWSLDTLCLAPKSQHPRRKAGGQHEPHWAQAVRAQ